MSSRGAPCSGAATQAPWVSSPLGMELVASQFYELGTTDFYPQLTRVLAENPDLIDVTPTPAAQTGLIVKQAREMGYDGLFVTVPPPMANIRVEIAGEHAEGFIGVGTSEYRGGTPKQNAFYQNYIDKYGGLWLRLCTLAGLRHYWPSGRGNSKRQRPGGRRSTSLDKTKIGV